VSFRIPPGRTIAVVGGSGSGQSTLARLLLRLYEPTAGRILVDGQELRQVSLASLRGAVGIVPQDTALFNETIAFNIAYGMSPNARAAMRLAARGAAQAAHLHEFIESLPEGYDTRVGERGMKLSGGERQRIAIARLIARNPRILIFDEATSALDPRAEQAIQAELDRLSERRSTLVIAHRMSTVERADEILVLEFGRIVERGSHRALLAQGGVYAQMCQVQLSEQRLHDAEQRLHETEQRLHEAELRVAAAQGRPR
jgi:ATP-binding cassette, subfamily B, bacterial